MFEIHKRHAPMFVTSEVKEVARAMTSALEFDGLNLREYGIEINPIFQTVRINENNQFILRSELSVDKVTTVLQEQPTLKKWRAGGANSGLFDRLLKQIVEQLKIDSFLYVDESKPVPAIEKILKKASKHSQKPVVIFNSPNALNYQFEEAKWHDLDHPAIWLENCFGPNTAETEAFFAISPALKMEVALNRFQTLESFGTFAVGMVRL